MKNKLFLASLAAAVAIPAMVAPIHMEAATTSFKDIGSLDKKAQEQIAKLVELKVISGFTDNTFRPSDFVTRGQFALFISKALELPKPSKPKSFSDVTTNVSTYDGIIKAYEAGIIAGYPDGRFRPNDMISRSDMAIMLDKALQYKGSYTNKATLTYSDKGSIGKTSYEAIQRLTHYKIMTAQKGTSFAPTAKGNRLTTVQSIHEMMKVKNLLVDTTPPVVKPEPPTKPGEVPFKEDSRDYTYDEVKQLIGRTDIVIERSGAGTGGSIMTTDMVKRYYDRLHAEGFISYKMQPAAYYQSTMSDFTNVHKKYRNAFPEYELIAVNGVPYRYTQYFPAHLKNPESSQDFELNNIIPAPPIEGGKFLIDIPTLNSDVVTYKKDDIQMEDTGVTPIKTGVNDFLVDIKGVFKDSGLVTVSADGLTISFNGKVLQLVVGSDKATLNGSSITLSAKVTTQGTKVLAPVQSVAKQLGLSTRKLDERRNHAKIEVANYELVVFNVDGGSYDGLGWER